MSYILKCSYDEQINKGDSRMFGCPDLPEDFDWPVDFDGYDMEFICQINCEEIHALNSDFLEKGHLYFFGCIANALGQEDAPELFVTGKGAKNKFPDGYFKVIYSDKTTDELLEGEIVDENGDPTGFEPIKLILVDVLDEPDKISVEPLSVIQTRENGVELLALYDLNGRDFTLRLPDATPIRFFITSENLRNKNFDKVEANCFL